MSLYDDIATVEGWSDEELDELEQAKAMQRVINEGTGWRLQGSTGRAMMAAIEAGDVMLGTTSARDYYGNTIPSRDDVADGTKGSYSYVLDHHGVEWADALKNV